MNRNGTQKIVPKSNVSEPGTFRFHPQREMIEFLA